MSLSALLAKGDMPDEAHIPEYISQAPAEVRRRVRALKKLHLESVDVQADFYSRVHELEASFRERFDALNAKVRFLFLAILYCFIYRENCCSGERLSAASTSLRMPNAIRSFSTGKATSKPRWMSNIRINWLK